MLSPKKRAEQDNRLRWSRFSTCSTCLVAPMRSPPPWKILIVVFPKAAQMIGRNLETTRIHPVRGIPSIERDKPH